MSAVTIYHHPRCSKSRQTLALLQEHGVHPQVILYMETPPDIAQLTSLLTKLGFHHPRELMRIKETRYRTLNLGDPNLSEEQLLRAMIAHPELIERPIVIKGEQARLGRPPENVLELL